MIDSQTLHALLLPASPVYLALCKTHIHHAAHPNPRSSIRRMTSSDTGVIQIYSSGTSVLLGYVGRFGFTSSRSDAWHYVYTVPESPDDLVNIPDTVSKG